MKENKSPYVAPKIQSVSFVVEVGQVYSTGSTGVSDASLFQSVGRSAEVSNYTEQEGWSNNWNTI